MWTSERRPVYEANALIRHDHNIIVRTWCRSIIEESKLIACEDDDPRVIETFDTPGGVRVVEVMHPAAAAAVVSTAELPPRQSRGVGSVSLISSFTTASSPWVWLFFSSKSTW